MIGQDGNPEETVARAGLERGGVRQRGKTGKVKYLSEAGT